MEILKCKVQDPGFPDTEVTCLKADDGQTYFFIEDGTLKNGNVISTPILKEGIGHAPYTSLGLITPQGEVLIPFENKNIKVLSNDLLLVERNTPVTEGVVEALGKQNDPLSASELIETANTIKEQIKSVMGPTGSYAFDNQFSEAALYTTAGVNLANDYFSFIGVNDGAYYMCKNKLGNSIVKYDPYMAVADEQTQESEQVPTVDNNIENNQEIEIPQVPTVEEDQSIVAPPSVDISGDPNQTEITSQETEISNDAILPNVDMNPATEIENNNNQNMELEIPSVDIPSESDVVADTPGQPQLNIEAEETSVELPFATNEINNNEEVVENPEVDLNIQEDIPTETVEENNISDIFNESESNTSDEYVQVEDDSQVSDEGGFDNTPNQTYETNNSDYFEEQITNPIIANATNTIRKLLEENRNQRQVIDRQESEIDTLNSSNEILTEDNSSKTKEIIGLRNSNAKYRSDNNDLSRENNRLKSTLQRQEELIEHLKSQNAALKEQVAGITALSNVVAEANNLFAPAEETTEYNNEYSYLDEDIDSYQYTKKAA